MADGFWTHDKVAAFRRYVEAGLSATKIGVELGCTRNVTAAKARRLGLRLGGKARRAALAWEEPEEAPEDQPGLSITDLGEFHCRALIVDAPARYCGQAVAHTRFRLCQAHADLYLTTPAKARATAKAALER